MRILEVNKFAYPRRGAERHFLDLCDVLRDCGHEVAIFSMDDSRNVFHGKYDRFLSAVGYNRGDSSFRQKLVGIGRLFWSFESRSVMRSMLDDFRPDVVHIHNAYHQLSLSFLPIIRKRGIPIIQTVHDYHLISPDKDEYYPSVGSSYWKFLFVPKYGVGKRLFLVLKSYWERMWKFREMIDRFIAPSEYVKQALVLGGIAEEKITVIPHFVIDSGTSEISVPDTPYALYFGGITEEKNIQELISLFERLRYPLVLAGRKNMDIEESEFVRYAGEKSKEELASLIAGSSFVVSASRLPETFGLIILEANVLGKPFLGYGVGAFPELVEDGRNGWLAKSEEEFERNISRFIRGEVVLDSPLAIRRLTFDRYGVGAYLNRFESMVMEVLSNAKS